MQYHQQWNDAVILPDSLTAVLFDKPWPEALHNHCACLRLNGKQEAQCGDLAHECILPQS